MSLLLNYNESIDTNNNNSNRLEWTDLINNSTKIIPKNNNNNNQNNNNNNRSNNGNDDFENNRLNQNIIVNQKESFDTKNSTINSLQDEIRDLKKKLKLVYEKDDIIHKLTVENQKIKDDLENYDSLISNNNKLETTNSELRRDLDNIVLQLMNQENVERENILIKKQLIKMDSELKDKKSELHELEIKNSLLIDKYQTLEYKYTAQLQIYEEQKELLDNLMKQKPPQIQQESPLQVQQILSQTQQMKQFDNVENKQKQMKT